MYATSFDYESSTMSHAFLKTILLVVYLVVASFSIAAKPGYLVGEISKLKGESSDLVNVSLERKADRVAGSYVVIETGET